MKKSIKFLLMTLGMIFMFVACGGNKDKNEATSETSGSNELVIYSPNADDEVNKLIPAFEKATGIKVILQSMGTGDVLARIAAEKENPQADINWGAINLGVYQNNPDLWEQYVSENDKNLPEAYRSFNGYFTNYKLSGSAALLINLDVFKKLGLDPNKFTGYKDLLWPELKGKIAMGDPTASSSAIAELTNMLLVMGEKPYDEKAWGYVEKFVGQLNGTILSSSSQIYKATVDGEYAVGVSYEDPCIALLEDGATNVKVVYPDEGAVWLPGGVAIVKNAPNMENAKKFIDFLISDEAQNILAETTIRPVNTAIKNKSKFMKPFDEIKMAYEDIPYTAEHRKEWQEKWTEILTK
jgi:iron (fe3+) ABC superfamily ATP binding cassette transporter binding protein